MEMNFHNDNECYLLFGKEINSVTIPESIRLIAKIDKIIQTTNDPVSPIKMEQA